MKIRRFLSNLWEYDLDSQITVVPLEALFLLILIIGYCKLSLLFQMWWSSGVRKETYLQ